MTKNTLGIDGMSCGMCEAHLNETVRRAFDVKSVTSSQKKGRMEIVSEQPLDEQALRSAINGTGYTVTAYSSEPYVKKGLFHWA